MTKFIIKFFQPLIKYPLLIIIASLIIGIALYVGVDIALGGLVRQNLQDIDILSSQVLSSSGYDSVVLSKTYANIIGLYNERLKQRSLANTLQVLFPKYSPENVLTSAKEALEKADDEEKAKQAILQAEKDIQDFYCYSARFPQSPIEWFKSEDISKGLPESIVENLDNAFDNSHESAIRLKNKKELTFENAQAAFNANKETILLLYLAQVGYDNPEKIDQFSKDMKQTMKSTERLAKRIKNHDLKQQVEELAVSIQLQAGILLDMLDNNMINVSKSLSETIKNRLTPTEAVGQPSVGAAPETKTKSKDKDSKSGVD